MEMSEKALNGITQPPPTAEDAELTKIYQEFLQKCCEAGQIRFQLDQLDGQKRELEKSLEVTERSVKSNAHKHRELQKEKFAKLKPADSPKLDIKSEKAH